MKQENFDEEMEPISEEIYVKDEPEYDQMNEADPEMIKDPEVAQLDEDEELKCRFCDFRTNLSA